MLDTPQTSRFEITFNNGQRARVLNVSSQQSPMEALTSMGLEHPQPTLVIIGGASLMSAEQLERFKTIFNQVLAPLAETFNLTVLDGGTDAGVIHMMGQARRVVGGKFRLVGVAPQGKVKLPGEVTDDPERYELETHHTDFLLIPGDTWGSESSWLAEFASLMATHRHSVTVLINGGQVALMDLKANLKSNRPVIVLAGSGRLADTIAAAMQGAEQDVDPTILELIRTYQPNQHLVALDATLPLEALWENFKAYFTVE